MKPEMNLTISLYGAFRAYADDPTLRLTVPADTTVGELRALLDRDLHARHPEFAGSELMTRSVFADDRDILRDHAVLRDGAAIAVLPPICGG